MKTRAEVIADRAGYESRAAGAFIGLAVGDAVGDLGRSQEHRNRYGLIVVSGRRQKHRDTKFGVLTARALFDCRGDLTRRRRRMPGASTSSPAAGQEEAGSLCTAPSKISDAAWSPRSAENTM